MRVIFNFILDYSNKKEDDLVWRDALFLEIDSCVCVVNSSSALIPITEFPFGFNLGLHTATEYRSG